MVLYVRNVDAVKAISLQLKPRVHGVVRGNKTPTAKRPFALNLDIFSTFLAVLSATKSVANFKRTSYCVKVLDYAVIMKR